jgi:hypothetical protein
MSLLCHSWFGVYGRFTISKVMTSHHFLCPTSSSPCMCNRPFPWCLQKTTYRKHTFVACMTCNCIASNLFHPKHTAFSSCNYSNLCNDWLFCCSPGSHHPLIAILHYTRHSMLPISPTVCKTSVLHKVNLAGGIQDKNFWDHNSQHFYIYECSGNPLWTLEGRLTH